MACDCLKVINTQLAEHNMRICEAFVAGIVDPVVVIQFEQLSDETPPMIFAPNYCPFCGVRYGHDPALSAFAGGEEVATHVH